MLELVTKDPLCVFDTVHYHLFTYISSNVLTMGGVERMEMERYSCHIIGTCERKTALPPHKSQFNPHLCPEG